jgi:transcriptional regulator with XRE-family HTH domain
MGQHEFDRAAGAKLKELRQQAGMSQEDLSFSGNIDQSTLSKIERLGPAVISWSRFCGIVKALGYEVEITFRPLAKSAVRTSVDSEGAHRQGNSRK